ncbi:MAG: NFACT family protein, partial [Clostridia bacterium]|nr:NFACT family protein [Clostridia bacterium]
MPQDLFTIKRYALELNNLLTGAKVNKITMPSKEEVILTLYGGKIFNVTLNASANFCRVGLTNLSKDNPLIAPNFCMLLRKHLTCAIVTSISVLNDDRIISVNFKNASEFNANENFSLICEVMGKYSNVFLVQNGAILGSLKPAPQTLENKRVLLTKSKYVYPEKQPKLNAYDLESLKLCFKNYKGESLNKFILQNFYEFSPVSAKELEYRILAKNNGVFDSEIAVKVTSEFINKKTDATVITLNNLAQFFAFDYESVTGERKRFNSIIDAMFFAYLGLENNAFITQKQNALMQKVNALEKKLIKKQNVLLNSVKESENAEIYKLYGELLTAYAYLIKKGQKSASLINYYDNEKIEIQLDENLTAVENAQNYYKKYSKLKNTLLKTKPQLEKIEEELKYLDSVKLAITLAKSKLDFIDIEEELDQNSNIKSQKV